jgi:SAM-dependent methyltransferase
MPGIARQYWSAERYAETAHFVPAVRAPVLELLAPAAGQRILDLGCGDGVLTAKIVAAGATVVAVDAGPDMIAAARVRGLDAKLMDGQKLTFKNVIMIKPDTASAYLWVDIYGDAPAGGSHCKSYPHACPAAVRSVRQRPDPLDDLAMSLP